MPASTLTPVNRTTGNALAKAFGPVPDGEEWSVCVRVCNSGAADDTFDLRLRKSDGSNASYRAKAHPVAVGAGTFDIEQRLVLPAGYEIWDRSAGGNVDASYTGTKRTTA